MSDRKLNIKRVRDAIIWLLLFISLGTVTFFAVQRKANADVKAVDIEIIGVLGDQKMISEKEIKRILMETAGKPITKSNIKTLNLRKLEQKLDRDKRIERADIYFDAKDILHVIVHQKVPVMRVVVENGADYYLDINGKKVQHTVGSAIRVPIVTGITETFTPAIFASDKPSKLRDIFVMLKKVQDDPFLTALVEQVHVNQDSIGDIIIIPKVGREQLVIGDARNLDEKFEKLKIFYRDGLPRLGWNRYKTLNLKYDNQIAGTLIDPTIPKIKMASIPHDSLQTAMVPKPNNNESIHH
jgi:cell division protein FtsQ